MSSARPRLTLVSLLASVAIGAALPMVELGPRVDDDREVLAPPAIVDAAPADKSEGDRVDGNAAGLTASRAVFAPVLEPVGATDSAADCEPGDRTPRYRLAPKTSPPRSA